MKGGGSVLSFFPLYFFEESGERVGEIAVLVGGMGGEREGSGEFSGGGDVFLWAGGNMVPGISVDGWICC